jgi:hypothetical protein
MQYQRLNKANRSDRHHATASFSKFNAVRQQPSLHQLQHAIGNRAVGQTIQAKLKISEPGDVHEREADRVADEVMRMPEPGDTQIQPMCTCCEDDQAMSMLSEGEEDEVEVEPSIQM